MINEKTILSVFNEKGTLLKWLQKVENALKGDTLSGVRVDPITDTQVKLTFDFNDGSSLASAPLTLAKGADGVGISAIVAGISEIVGTKTITPVTVTKTDGTQTTLNINAENGAPGADGKDGNGVVSITTIGTTPGTGQYEGYTQTNLNLDTEESTLPFEVYARNGVDGKDGTDGAPGETGAAGVGLESITALAPYIAGDQTITPIVYTKTDGETGNFTVQAKNGTDGSGTEIEHITITSPSTAVSGTLTSDQYAILSKNDNNFIIFDNEIYLLQDKEHEAGYLIYSHVGHNNAGDFKVKCITITVTTLGWVLTTQDIRENHLYMHSMRAQWEYSWGGCCVTFVLYSTIATPFNIDMLVQMRPNKYVEASGNIYLSLSSPYKIGIVSAVYFAQTSNGNNIICNYLLADGSSKTQASQELIRPAQAVNISDEVTQIF